jgi:uncharacterized protein (TIGR02246 family)
MSKIVNFTTALLFCALCATTAQAQSATDVASVKSFWKEVWQSYQTGNTEQVMKVYTENSSSITPDGRIQVGKTAMKEDWENLMKMVDEAPKFTYEEPTIRLITPDVAIVTYSTEADIKMGGQQVGGKTIGMAVLHKINGKWMVESDSMTPVMPMPEEK